MIVRLAADAAPELTDLDRLDRLHAECPGRPADVALDEMVFADWCQPADDAQHVWLDVDACRSFGSAACDDGWTERYDAMISYASSKGWTNESGSHVLAHVEHTSRTDQEPT